MTTEKNATHEDLGDHKPLTFEDLEPQDQIRVTTESFIIDLECTREMFEVVVPSLKQKDEERKARINEISVFFEALPSKESIEVGDTASKVPVEPGKVLREAKTLLDALRRLNRADEMFRQNTILTLVSRYDQFLAKIYSHILQKNPSRLESSERKLTYREVLQLGSIDQAIDKFVNKEVDRWLRQTHIEKLESLDELLKAGLVKNITCWKFFVELIERRHLFAHTGGQVTSQYLQICKENNIKVETEQGKHLKVDETYFENAYRCLFEIGIRIGQAGWKRLYPDNLEASDSSLNDIGYSLLLSEQWELATVVFDFALNIPSKLISSDVFYKMYLINKCIALKQLGKEEEQRNLLNSVDWSAAHPKFVLASHVLKEEYDQAEDIMSSMSGKEPSEQAFMTWPLFRDFRETEHFRRAFKKLYNKEYELEAAREIADTREDTLPLEET